jgi:hypothetical protein
MIINSKCSSCVFYRDFTTKLITTKNISHNFVKKIILEIYAPFVACMNKILTVSSCEGRRNKSDGKPNNDETLKLKG